MKLNIFYAIIAAICLLPGSILFVGILPVLFLKDTNAFYVLGGGCGLISAWYLFISLLKNGSFFKIPYFIWPGLLIGLCLVLDNGWAILFPFRLPREMSEALFAWAAFLGPSIYLFVLFLVKVRVIK